MKEELGSDSYFLFNIYTICKLLASGASQKKKIKINFDPPRLPNKYQHKTPPLINLMGVRIPAPPPPQDPLMLVVNLGIEFYLFVSHGGMNDRGST